MNSDAHPKGDPGKQGPFAAQGEEKESSFQLHRSAPVEPQASLPIPAILIGVVVVLVGLGIYMMSTSGTTENGSTKGNGTNPPKNGVVEKSVPLPDFASERLTFLEDEGRIEQALEQAEEYLKTYPSKQLNLRITRYKKELGLVDEPLQPVKTLLLRAKAALQERDFAAAIKHTEDILAQEEDHAEAYFISGVAKGNSGDRLGATEDLRSAEDLGHTQAAGMLEKFQNQ